MVAAETRCVFLLAPAVQVVSAGAVLSLATDWRRRRRRAGCGTAQIASWLFKHYHTNPAPSSEPLEDLKSPPDDFRHSLRKQILFRLTNFMILSISKIYCRKICPNLWILGTSVTTRYQQISPRNIAPGGKGEREESKSAFTPCRITLKYRQILIKVSADKLNTSVEIKINQHMIISQNYTQANGFLPASAVFPETLFGKLTTRKIAIDN